MRVLRKKQSVGLLHEAELFCEAYRDVRRAFEKMDLGAFGQENLRGVLAAEPRAERTTSATGCRSCEGVLAFPSGRVYVETYLLDGAEPRIGGLKISRERLRSLIELPAENLLEAFDKAVEELRRWLRFEKLTRFNPATGLPEPDLELIELEAAGGDLILPPQREGIYNSLVALATALTSTIASLEPIRQELKFEVPGLRKVPGRYDSKNNGFTLPTVEVDESWVLNTLGVARKDLPKQ